MRVKQFKVLVGKAGGDQLHYNKLSIQVTNTEWNEKFGILMRLTGCPRSKGSKVKGYISETKHF